MGNTLIVGGTTGIGAAVAFEMGLFDPIETLFLPPEERFDVANPIMMHQWILLQQRQFGPLDQVVYSAGVNFPAMLGTVPDSRIRHTFRVNVEGFINLLDILAVFQPKHPTSIVAIISNAADTPMRGSIAYCASKAALAMAVRCAAREMAPAWRVNGIAPGTVADTPMTDRLDEEIPLLRGWTAEAASEYELSMVPMGRRATVKEVADATLYALTGPEFMTGAILSITGGK